MNTRPACSSSASPAAGGQMRWSNGERSSWRAAKSSTGWYVLLQHGGPRYELLLLLLLLLTLVGQVLADAMPGREKLLSDHLTTYPMEATPLRDTAADVWLMPRAPSGQAFWPIGHLALEKQAEDDADMGLAKEGSVWIKHLYISWAIQAGGIGKASMQAVEALAKLEPLFGTTIVLDTAQKETQSSDEWKRFFFTDMGRPIPEVSSSSSDTSTLS